MAETVSIHNGEYEVQQPRERGKQDIDPDTVDCSRPAHLDRLIFSFTVDAEPHPASTVQ